MTRIHEVVFPEGRLEYVVEEELGKGGHAIVYRGRMVSTNIPGFPTHFAVKSQQKEDGKKREGDIAHEARILGELQHPNIIRSFGFVDTDKGSDLFLEYVDVWETERVILPDDVALTLLSDVGEGLVYAHSKGYAHRDIKHWNIGKNGAFKILDWGLACHVGDGLVSDEILGSPRYMAPEIDHGFFKMTAEERQRVDMLPNSFYSTAADMWALGICVHSLYFDHKEGGYSVDWNVVCSLPSNKGAPSMNQTSIFLESLAAKLLVVDPINRMTAQQMVDEIKSYKEFRKNPAGGRMYTVHR